MDPIIKQNEASIDQPRSRWRLGNLFGRRRQVEDLSRTQPQIEVKPVPATLQASPSLSEKVITDCTSAPRADSRSSISSEASFDLPAFDSPFDDFIEPASIESRPIRKVIARGERLNPKPNQVVVLGTPPSTSVVDTTPRSARPDSGESFDLDTDISFLPITVPASEPPTIQQEELSRKESVSPSSNTENYDPTPSPDSALSLRKTSNSPSSASSRNDSIESQPTDVSPFIWPVYTDRNETARPLISRDAQIVRFTGPVRSLELGKNPLENLTYLFVPITRT